MSDHLVNEPRRHHERLNRNEPDGHRALWNLSQRRETDDGWNVRASTRCPLSQVGNRPDPADAGSPVDEPARPNVENAA